MSLSRALLAGTGIAAGVTALIVVLGVMGGLQQGYIDSILEISSFHLRVELPESFASGDLSALRAIPGVKSVVAFKETHVLALGPSGQALTLSLRAFPEGAERDDPSLARALGLSSRERLPQKGSIVLGKEAAALLGADEGTPIELFGMTQSDDEGVVPVRKSIPVGSVFSSGYYEFDSSMGFVPLEESSALSRAYAMVTPVLGIKLDNRYADYRMAATIRGLLPEGSGSVLSWRDYNRSFFGALRTEKSMMMLLISLIFVVVGINIFHAMRRVIASKMSDIAVLKACGATDSDIRWIFIVNGLSIGLIGAFAGTALGLVLSANINRILELAASVLRFFSSLLGALGLSASNSDFRLFSPSYFYIDAIPVSITTAEIIFIALTAIASTGMAALIAARKVSEAKPSEVFRNE
ncbi:MAG TPA: ABC transporter permease [Rectinemataceae bacterium]|nr:ABC transporter permease [Rectinemataceae bacterium]